jgi:hypothetical protein
VQKMVRSVRATVRNDSSDLMALFEPRFKPFQLIRKLHYYRITSRIQCPRFAPKSQNRNVFPNKPPMLSNAFHNASGKVQSTYGTFLFGNVSFNIERPRCAL